MKKIATYLCALCMPMCMQQNINSMYKGTTRKKNTMLIRVPKQKDLNKFLQISRIINKNPLIRKRKRYNSPTKKRYDSPITKLRKTKNQKKLIKKKNNKISKPNKMHILSVKANKPLKIRTKSRSFSSLFDDLKTIPIKTSKGKKGRKRRSKSTRKTPKKIKITRSPFNTVDGKYDKKLNIIAKKIQAKLRIKKINKGVQTPSMFMKKKSSNDLATKKTKTIVLDDIDIDFTIYKREKDGKKVLGVNGTVLFYDIRKFTFFCNKCSKNETPAFFMSDLSDIVEKIVKKWGGKVVSIAGDGYVVIFPKKKNEKTFEKSVITGIICGMAIICETLKFMKEKRIKYSKYCPEKSDLGLEIGQTCFYKLSKTKKLIPMSGVSKTINNAERYQEHSKNCLVRKITISEKIWNIININKNGKKKHKILIKLFTKQILNAKGIKGRPFVRSCKLGDLQKFYNSGELKKYEKRKRKRKFKYNLSDLVSIF
ncbi:adenylate/guanylate cyclase domain-containing protein [Candidatus Dependentiae bacterium]